MRVRFRDREWTFEERKQVRQLLKELGFSPQTHLVVRNGQLVTEDAWLEPEDEVKIVPVISGGGGG